MTIILTAQSIREAEAVARHLHASLTSVLQSPPVQGHRAATLSSELGVGRMTCQRIMKLAKTSADPGPELLAELPGVGGLREFLEAVIRAGVPRSSLADAFAAVNTFERYLREIGLSQTGFDSALRLFHATTDPDRLRDRRVKLFEATSAITGQAADLTTSMMAIRPSEQGRIQLRADRGARVCGHAGQWFGHAHSPADQHGVSPTSATSPMTRRLENPRN